MAKLGPVEHFSTYLSSLLGGFAGCNSKPTQKRGQICGKSVQLVRGSSFRNDFLQNPYFKGITYFFRKRDTTCHSGDGVFDTICEVSLYIYAIITSNMFEAILLYFCIKAIEKQNDAAQELIGQDQHRKRRRYSKIVFNL